MHNSDDGAARAINLELLYTPTTTANGNPEGPKLNFPYNHVAGFPNIQDLGDDKEAYRWNFQLRNNRVRDDFSRMMRQRESPGHRCPGSRRPAFLSRRRAPVKTQDAPHRRRMTLAVSSIGNP